MTLQLFDALPAHIEDALRASIRRFGVLVPVVRDQDGRVIDGHHRVRLAEELGVECPERHVTVADDDEAREIARTLNSDRRHLSEEQRREIVAELRGQGHSERAIAGALGVSQPTVHRDLARGDSHESPDQPATVRGMDGKEYASSRPQSKPETEPDVIDPGEEPAPHPDLGAGEFWEPPADGPAHEPTLPQGQDRADEAHAQAQQRATTPAPKPKPPEPPVSNETYYALARQQALNAYSEAVDGLIYLEAYTNSHTPPDHIPDHYPSIENVVARIEAVLTTWKEWADGR